MLPILLGFLFATFGARALSSRNGFRVVGRDTALKTSYDFVVVGGGTAGLTVADRLTENPTGKPFSILLKLVPLC